MTRTGKILSWTFATLVLLLAVLVLIIVFFDWNRIKPPLNAKVSEELHRPFAINGNLAVIWQREPDEGGWRSWVPWPHVVAEDLSLGNPDWSKKPQMVTLKRVELRISPLALLAQRVVIPRIDLTEPNAELQRLAGVGALAACGGRGPESGQPRLVESAADGQYQACRTAHLAPGPAGAARGDPAH